MGEHDSTDESETSETFQPLQRDYFLPRIPTPYPHQNRNGNSSGNGRKLMTKHEKKVLELLIKPSQLDVTWKDVAGCENLIKSI